MYRTARTDHNLPLDAGSIVRAGLYAQRRHGQLNGEIDSRAVDVPVAPELMSPGELQEILTRTCSGKDRYAGPARARRAAFAARAHSGRRISAYRCPFGDGTRAAAHWHIGRVPSLASLERIALAVRQRAQGAAGGRTS